MRLIYTLLAGLLLFAGVAGAVDAGDLPAYPQQTKPDGGFMPSRTFNITDLESVSVTSGNLVLQLPLVALPPGRAGMGGALNLTYNSSIWELRPRYEEDTDGSMPGPYVTVNELQATDASYDRGGWQFGFEYKLVNETKETPAEGITNICLSLDELRRNKMLAVFPDGSRHTLYLVGDEVSDSGWSRYRPDGIAAPAGNCPLPAIPTPLSYYTTDGTFLQVHVDNNGQWTMMFPDGRRVVGHGETTETIYDRNGNYVTVASIANLDENCDPTCDPLHVLEDQFGRQVTIAHQANGDDVITQVGYEGQPKTWTISYKSIQLGSETATYYICANFQNKPAADNLCQCFSGFTVIDKVTFPTAGSDTTSYVFDYADNNGGSTPFRYGMLNKVELQVNGSPTYTATYSYDKDDQQISTYSQPELWQFRVVSKNVVHTPNFPGAAAQTETTGYQYIGSAPYRTVVTAPDNGITTHYYRNDNLGGGEQSKNSLVYRIDMPNGDSIRNFWQKNQAYHVPGETGGFQDDQGNPYIRAAYRIVPNAGTSAVVTTVDKNGNVLQKAEYDYGVEMPTLPDPLVSGEPTGLPPGTPAPVPVRTVVNSYRVVAPVDDGNDEPPDTVNGYWQAVSNPAVPRIINSVERSEVRQGSATGTIYAVTEFDYDSAGNPTNQLRWKSDMPTSSVGPLNSGNSIETVTAYTSSGNVSLVIDPNGNQTRFTYAALDGCPASYTDLYPTMREDGANSTSLKRTFTFKYDCNTGLPIEQTDADNGISGDFDYDKLGRPISTVESNLREVHYVYDDADRTVTAKLDRLAKGDEALVTVTHYDAFGRVALTRSNDPNPPSVSNPYSSGAASGIKTEARYFRGGGVRGYDLASNPYRSSSGDETMGWTRTKYDTSGRVEEVGYFNGASAPSSSSTPDTGAVTTSYSGNQTTVVDQAGVSRTSTTDALGRLVRVVENGINSHTCYTYDVLDNLIQVRQNGGAGCTGGQVRTFNYDSLGRLRSATNPESGVISYTYDANGNLLTREDDRIVSDETKVKMTYEPYDALNRPTVRKYNDGTPQVNFSYDAGLSALAGQPCYNKGRLTSVVTQGVSTSERSCYDAVGRLRRSTQTPAGGLGYQFDYSYNLDDSLATEEYPSGRIIAYEYDGAGRSLKAGLATVGATGYLQTAAYAPHGAASSMTLGNNLVEQTTFNGRLQPTEIEAGSLLTLTFGYGTTANNGNVMAQTISGTGIPTFSQAYTYDNVNRLQTMVEGSMSRTYAYDAYGNRALTNGSQVGPGTPSSTANFNAANNRLIASWAEYDPAGNLEKFVRTGAGLQWTAAYDAENKQRYYCDFAAAVCDGSNADAEYIYDGEGNRIRKLTEGVTTTYVYDAFGRLAAEYQQGGSSQMAETLFRTTDHLGSTRLVTNAAGSVKSRHDFFPFGQEIDNVTASGRNGVAGYGESPGLPQLFTAKERDQESGLDYFLARYYSGSLGRFTSADAPLVGQSPSSPQSWNLYGYVQNNPLNHIDPDGHCGTDVDCWKEFGSGVADTTYRPIVHAVSHPVDTLSGIGQAVAHPVDTAVAVKDAVVDTTSAALSGDPNAIGKVTGTIISTLATAGAAKGVSAAAEAGGVARGLSKFGGVFESQATASGGRLYTSTGLIGQSDVATIVNSASYTGGKINILSGVHGAANGAMMPAVGFFNADVKAFGSLSNVAVHDISTMGGSQIQRVVNGPGTTIGAFCNSGACLQPFVQPK